MITDILINALLERATASLELLERLEAKLDAQAISKLRGAIRSLKTAMGYRERMETAVQIALSSFTESSEYFRSLTESAESELSFDIKFERRPKIGKILGWGQYVAGSVRDLLGLGEGQLSRQLLLEVERIDCINLFMLSEIGRIACMVEIGYNANIIQNDIDRLRSTHFKVDSDWLMERVIELELLPPHIANMEKQIFAEHYGTVLDYDTIQQGDQKKKLKLFVIEHYGNTIGKIKKNHPGYKAICLKVGREPKKLDDYVDMLLTYAAEDDGLFDGMGDWAKKNILYWADDNLLIAWAQAFYRYAALITICKTKNTPNKLLAAMELRSYDV